MLSSISESHFFPQRIDCDVTTKRVERSVWFSANWPHLLVLTHSPNYCDKFLLVAVFFRLRTFVPVPEHCVPG